MQTDRQAQQNREGAVGVEGVCVGQGLARREPAAWQETGLLASLMPLQRGCEASELGVNGSTWED